MSRCSDSGAKSGKTRRHDRIAVRAFGSLQRSPGAFLQMALLAPFWDHNYPKTADPQYSAGSSTCAAAGNKPGRTSLRALRLKKESPTVVYATQLIYTCTTPIRYNHAYTHYTRQPKVPCDLTGGGRCHLGALHPKDNKRQDKTRQGKNLE